MFQLSGEEFKKLDIPKWNIKLGRNKNCALCFTEQGIALLSGMLSSDTRYSPLLV
jgi:hypothetical protein